jgi:hypothetical protein
MKVPASKIINAYGFRKEGAKTIIKILDGAQGYSRKFEVLLRLANRELKSERKLNNGLKELEAVGFVKISKAGDKAKRIKLDKRIWNRDVEVINLERAYILKRLNQNGRWLSPKTLTRDTRNIIEQSTSKKPLHSVVDAHLKIILGQHKHNVNESGLVRLAKFRVANEPFLIQKNINTSAFNNLHKETEQISTRTNPETHISNGIDFEEDDDIFGNNSPENGDEETYDNDENSNEVGIDEDIFGPPPGGNETEITEITIANDEVFPNRNLTHDYFKKVSEKLYRKEILHISESFNELSIKVDDITITITNDPSRNELLVISQHELTDSEIMEALRMYGKSDMIGQLGIETKRGVDFLFLRKRIFAFRYKISEILSMVERIIYESIQLQKIKD